jgi:hypothetical protein
LEVVLVVAVVIAVMPSLLVMRVVLPAHHRASSLHQNDLRNNFQEKVRTPVTATFSLKKREKKRELQKKGRNPLQDTQTILKRL